MENQFSRTELLIGKEAVEKLKKSKVVIFGIGGVGSYVLEGLARAGISNFILIDADVVDVTNINRQIIATHSTIGKDKVEVAKNRVLEINKDAKVECIKERFMPDSKDFFDDNIDYVVDAIDNITAKIEIIKRAKAHNIPVISCMGTGNKFEPSKFEITDIYKTSVCPLAKIIRKKMRENNIDSLKVLYSKEEPITNQKSDVIASISFVPSVAGLMIAGEIIKDIIK